jgi:hypothetical protein
VAKAYEDFVTAREELMVYSRRLGLVMGGGAGGDAPAPDLDLTVDTAEELLRLDDKVKGAWAVYQDAQGGDGGAEPPPSPD